MNEPDDDGREVIKIQKDLLWGRYMEARVHARHAETLRSNAVNYMLVTSSGLIAVITFDDNINRYDLPLCILVALVGLVTGLFSASYAELFFRNRQRGERLLKELDLSFFEGKAPATLAALTAQADAAHRKSLVYRWSRRLSGSTHLFWLVLPLVVFVIGVVLTSLSWSNAKPPKQPPQPTSGAAQTSSK